MAELLPNSLQTAGTLPKPVFHDPKHHIKIYQGDCLEILAASKPGDVVLDPFAGSGTTMIATLRHRRAVAGIESSSEYAWLAARRVVAKLVVVVLAATCYAPSLDARLATI